ncbi:MAG TPA: amidohydrolase family protein [Candidatus Corynebacterium avicola]|uniref:Amidohydrolase family protein n=1 Tax=Candidatus Corynebacterium avicola TaxID=2838527 RepID=A0A9D1UK73_9CORY|nr:amidohydrolase family protein [Candidatus Corynebacterium avicola]
MKITALEEHIVTPPVLEAWSRQSPADRDLAYEASVGGDTGRRLLDTDDARREAMARTGVDVQVLSLTTPGLQSLPTDEALGLQRTTNDHIAGIVQQSGGTFQGLAALATGTPGAAAEELERCVQDLGLDGAMLFGRSGTMSVDDPRLDPLWATAERLQAPLYLHPQSPPPEVRAAYYDGLTTGTGAGHSADLDAALASGFATHGIGWHYDAGVQFLRMVLSGVFDRFPRLQLVMGHWGELVLFYLERIDHLVRMADRDRTLQDYVGNNLYVTPSGMLSDRYLSWAVDVIGTDRIMFSTDYPFEAASQSGAREFLTSAPISQADKEKIGSGNWDRLRDGIVR